MQARPPRLLRIAAGHAPHDRPGRCPRVDLPPRAARVPRRGRRLRVRPRRIRRRRRRGARARLPEGKVVRMRLEGIGFGFLIPVYFVVTGMNFDLDSLLTAEGLALAALFLGVLLVTRGASALLWLRELGRRETASLALFGATALPLIVAIVGIAQERGDISKAVGGVAHRRGDDLRARVPVRRDGGAADEHSEPRTTGVRVLPDGPTRAIRPTRPAAFFAELATRRTTRSCGRRAARRGSTSSTAAAYERWYRRHRQGRHLGRDERRVVTRTASSARTRPSSTGSPQGS